MWRTSASLCAAWLAMAAVMPAWAVAGRETSSVLPGQERPLLAPGPREPFALSLDTDNATYRSDWNAVRRQIAADRATLAACRADEASCPDAARRFLGIVEAGRNQEGRARFGEINRAVNLAIKYVPDQVQHGQEDVWSAPLATFATGMGDCEDYAIAKYVALLEAGVAEADLRLVILRDTKRGEIHAVAAARLDGDWLLLDNTRFALATDRDTPEFRPLVALDGNEVAARLIARGTISQDDNGPSRAES